MIGFERDGADIAVLADGVEAEILGSLVDQLGVMLGDRGSTASGLDRPAAPDDPALLRLLPDAIRGDESAARELRGLIEPSLIAHKRAALAVVAASIVSPGPLTSAAETAWLTSLTDLRLTIATRLGIEGDRDRGRWETDADLAMQEVYRLLAVLQEQLVELIEARDDAAEDAAARDAPAEADEG